MMVSDNPPPFSPTPPTAPIPALCRDCGAQSLSGHQRCPACKSPRLIRHGELFTLSIAHLDCDAFYASVEKRDNPDLANRPVIVGGGQRGVVATACYIARLRGVHSAMPMVRARELCPDAVVIRPNMDRYRDASRAIRALMDEVAPVVEPLSLDEAFLDLTGTARLHGMAPAEVLVRLQNRIRREVGVTVSIGLSYNKFLAKVASDRDKPKGFFVIGKTEARDFLASEPVSLIWGAGNALCRKLERDGIYRIGQLQAMDEATLRNRYGSMGERLYHFARGEDRRTVNTSEPPKSVSAEITFEIDIRDASALDGMLWQVTEDLCRRLRRKGLSGRTVTLKLKTADFKLRTRSLSINTPTRLAAILYRTGRHLLSREVDGTAFRLIGLGVSDLVPADMADPPDLVDPERSRARTMEGAMDKLRDKFGDGIVRQGRGFGASGAKRSDPDKNPLPHKPRKR